MLESECLGQRVFSLCILDRVGGVKKDETIVHQTPFNEHTYASFDLCFRYAAIHQSIFAGFVFCLPPSFLFLQRNFVRGLQKVLSGQRSRTIHHWLAMT